ncbi:hypothetical protein A0H81_13009 [Grifola frondosa]|uniref:Uncharacterized protein n=1 Tax=Grifola frondosa TaxID=5627 RepID=A0A1C7LRN9_GRIFR|nr:hypothetical protein A0H81_13009 [Grifola frondosa]
MKFFALVSAICALPSVFAGPIAYGICQTGCNAVVVVCYAGAGFTFGTVTRASEYQPPSWRATLRWEHALRLVRPSRSSRPPRDVDRRRSLLQSKEHQYSPHV